MTGREEDQVFMQDPDGAGVCDAKDIHKAPHVAKIGINQRELSFVSFYFFTTLD
tara:strand:+ start:382 stop:543 length:162 start_codon:yes stop_codon:yes gene_type:complete